MKTKLLLFLAFFTMLTHVSVAEELWVGQQYQCFASDYYNTRLSQFNVSWSVDYGLNTNYSGTHVRTVSFNEYKSGTYNVKVTWMETDMSNDYDPSTYHRSHTWSFTCKDNPLVLSESLMNLTTGQSRQLSCSHTYNNPYIQNINYSSSNTSVATVNSSGLVTAKGVGTTYITVSSASSRYDETCTVTVTSSDILVTDITLNKTALSLQAGQEETLTAAVYPNNAMNKSVTWSSSNNSVATVNSNGKVTALAEGTATITCKANDGSGVKATCSITVTETGIAINEINFPDANFRNWILEQDYGKDGKLTENEIISVTLIDVSQRSIKNLNGIEHFTALTWLECWDNQLTALDVSKNTALTDLYCWNNKLTALDVSKNTALTRLDCNINQLTALDVSKNLVLKELWSDNNQIKGVEMDKLINSLPQNTTGETHVFCVFDSSNSSEGNVCTKTQVSAAKTKGWMPKYFDGTVWLEYEGSEESSFARGDVNGNGEVNGTDLVALANIILGKLAETSGADVNGDGQVNGTDIVSLSDIILGKDK